MTQLMFAIANNPHPPIRDYNPALPVDRRSSRALVRTSKRYQTGAELAGNPLALQGRRRSFAGT
jgi:hypothetical protein